MKSLLITLGHNSSAIFVNKESSTVIGYEQERLSKIKADSEFPHDAISEIIKHVGLKEIKGCNIYVSHWFNFVEKGMPNKYITSNNLELLNSISDNIAFVNSAFTHHDAHAFSALSFYSAMKKDAVPSCNNLYTIVADGFGNNEEVISVYITDKNNLKKQTLLKRVYGYGASLGLMYQYATSFCGMKENQDEYKLLGYEAHIKEFIDDICLAKLNKRIAHEVNRLFSFFEAANNEYKPSETKKYIDLAKLQSVKNEWHDIFANVIAECTERLSQYGTRVVIAYFVQNIIENYFSKVIAYYNMNDICLAGGCFYNVKLNNSILRSVSGLFSVVPLAGDQGAAIGMYYNFEKEEFPFHRLDIGKRNMSSFKKICNGKDIFVRNFSKETAVEIAQLIADGYIVDIINGNMEFGPRALCNTSTVMLPTATNVECNNIMNQRNEVMPCAPICTAENALELFEPDELYRTVGSHHFMICTYRYTKRKCEQYAGVMHNEPLTEFFTGRPQIVRKCSFMDIVLNEVEDLCGAKCLVNTSFNVHGNPIVFSAADAKKNFEFQKEHAPLDMQNKVVLFIIC